MKQKMKRFVALALTLCMVITMLPMTAMAALWDNTPQYNEEMLATLRQMVGDNASAEEIYDMMQQYGVLDAEGNVPEQWSIELDGAAVTLDELRSILAAEDVDLSRAVVVDGTTLTLGELKTMLEIEDYLAYLQTTYFGDYTLTGEQQASLQSLADQLQTEGMTLYGAVADDALVFPSGLDHTQRITVSPTVTIGNDGGTLTLTLAHAAKTAITVSYTVANGSASGTLDGKTTGTLTIAQGQSSASAAITCTDYDAGNTTNRWNGNRSFVVNLSSDNALFANNRPYASVSVLVGKTFSYGDLEKAEDGTIKKRVNSYPKPWEEYQKGDVYECASFVAYDGVEENSTVDRIGNGLMCLNQREDTGVYANVNVMSYPNGPFYQIEIGQELNKISTHPGSAKFIMKYLPPDTILIQDGIVTNYVSDSVNFSLKSYDGSLLFNGEKLQSVTTNETGRGQVSFGLNKPIEKTDTQVEFELTVETTGIPDTSSWPEVFRFLEMNFPYLVDGAIPAVSSVTAPAGTYFAGQTVPITVTFAEPVCAGSLQLTANGKQLSAVDTAAGSFSAKQTFLYTVQPADNTSILVSGVSGAVDLSGKAMTADDTSRPLSDVALDTPSKADALTGMSAAITNPQTTPKLIATVSVSANEKLTDWLVADMAPNSEGELVSKSLTASMDGENFVPLSAVGETLSGGTLTASFDLPFNTGTGEAAYVVELYLNGAPMLGSYAATVQAPAKFITANDITLTYSEDYPADTSTPVYVQDNKALKLGYTLSGSGYTWAGTDDLIWSSSDESIAAIDPGGNITPTGKDGTVHFTLTATNGGVAGKAVTVDSREVKFAVGLTPFLTIPENVSTIYIVQGKDAVVNWTSNLCAKNGDTPTTFHIEVKKNGGEIIHETDLSGTSVSSYVIPASVLTEISAGSAAAYTVTVSSVYEGKTYSATANIHTTSQPATVKLTALPKYYITDETQSVNLNWVLGHYDTVNNAEFELRVTRNEEKEPVYQQTSTENSGGSYALALRDVPSYRDVYTVSVKAKNSADSTWSYDSFVLYVYDGAALKLWVGGADASDALTMSNVQRIAEMDQAQILALKRDISLAKVVSINYGDHAWGEISDQIAWASSKSNVASLNYQRGTLYENIEMLNYTSFRPASQFVLSGLQDGNTTVRATHVLTGMTDSMNVTVETLKDKLYLFQCYPQASATLSYTNGDGVKKDNIPTDENGAAAIYEPSGINSNVYMTAKKDGITYLGTYYQEGLVSGEADSTKLALYPCNNMKLQQAAYAALYLKKPDGTPYQGNVTLRAGVYVNDVYRENAKFAPQGTGLVNKDGGQDMNATVGADGKLVMQMDVSQWLAGADLKATDKVQYVFEVRTGKTYYPQLITVDANLSQNAVLTSGDSIVALKAAKNGEEPFIVTQTMHYDADGAAQSLENNKDNVGPGKNHPTATINTTVYWWGCDSVADASAAANTLQFTDRYGIVPKGQSFVNQMYPFSDLLRTEHTFVLDSSSMAGWLNTYETAAMTLKYSENGTTVRKSEALPFTIVNMLGAQDVTGSEAVKDAVRDIRNTTATSGSATIEGLGLADELIGKGIVMLAKTSDTDNSSQVFTLKLAPTADPLVYAAFCSVQLGSTDDVDSISEDYDKNGFGNAQKLNYTPGFMDTLKILKGTYLKEAQKTVDNANRNGVDGDTDFSGSLSGYVEGKVILNTTTKHWELQVLSGGFNTGFSAGYDWTYNSMVGPVPVTASLGVGGTVQLGMDMLSTTYYTSAASNYGRIGTDYLTHLRLYFYVRAFGGIGFDYSIVAFKVGLFGQVDLDIQLEWLNRAYLEDANAVSKYVRSGKGTADTDKSVMNGQYYSATGQVGLQFFAKFLFLSYEKTLASKMFRFFNAAEGEWVTIEDIWKYNKSQISTQNLALQNATGLYAVSDTETLESRSYLDEYTREWNGLPPISPFALDEDQKVVTELQTNAYPYANPVLTDDGQVMLYLTDSGSKDVAKTRVAASLPQLGVYQQGSIISDDGYGDSSVRLAGNKDYAAAVWVRQNLALDKDAGDAVTPGDQMLMMNSSEIMASIYTGNTWTSTRLTDNASADLAPVVATNGSRTLVAWRSVSAGDSENVTEFDTNDQILYRIYDGTNWSEPFTLYNGTSGSVKGIEADMLADGTAAVAYTLDTDGVSDTITDRETVCAVVGTDNSVTRNIRLTNDSFTDENPQITTATFNDTKERFVLGWYSEQDANGVTTADVRLCALDAEGALYGDMPDSISQATRNVTVSSNFRFIKNTSTIDTLSILWAESVQGGQLTEGDKLTADKSILQAVKFVQQNEVLTLTPAIEVASMPDYTLIDSFDAYVSDPSTDEIKAVILGTNYNQGYEEKQVAMDGFSGTALVPKSVSGLYTATENYENVLKVDSVMTDLRTVIRGCIIPVQFGVENGGIEPITELKITLAGATQTYSNLNLLPGDSITLTTDYTVPLDGVVNPAYTVNGWFLSGVNKQVADTLYLDVPDVGISKLDVLSEANGQRVVQLSLYNQTDAKLAGSDRYVELNFYKDSAYSEAVKTVTINAEDALALIDAGGYTTQVTIPLTDLDVTYSEIPSEGVTLYGKARIMAKDPLNDGDQTYYEATEFYPADNYASTQFYSLLERTGEPVTVTSELRVTNGQTQVDIDVRNNSLIAKSSGNLIVSLLDDSGAVLDTVQTYDAAKPNNGLLTLGGEESLQQTFTFEQPGTQVVTQYSDVVLEETPATAPVLSSISCDGVAVSISDFAPDATLENTFNATVASVDLTSTTVKVGLLNPADTVTINGVEKLSATTALHQGDNKITVIVKNADNLATTYHLTIRNTKAVLDPPAVLASLTCSGLSVTLGDFTKNPAQENTYTASTSCVNLNSTEITIGTTKPEHTATINGVSGLTGTVPLTVGVNVIALTITNEDGVVTTYELTVNNSAITDVTVTPKTISVNKGATQQFAATVEGSDQPAQTVNWTLEGYTGTASNISADGLLTVGSGETEITLTVKAASAFDITKSGTATVTVTTPSGGGSTGGGSTGNGGSTTVTPSKPTPDNPTPPTIGTVETPVIPDKDGHAKVDVSDSSIKDAIKKAQEQAKKDGTTDNGISVTVDITSKETANSISASLSAATIERLIAAKVKDFTIQSGLCALHFDLETLKQIRAQAGNNEVLISVGKQDVSKLSKEAQSAIGNRPAFTITTTYQKDSKTVNITDLGNGLLSVGIPYTKAASEQSGGLYGVYVDGTGKVTYLTDSSYDENSKMLLFGTDHLSIYGVGYKAAPQFTDITNHWAKSDIEFVASRGLLMGTGNNKFSPNSSMTRGMFVTALGRLAEIDPEDYKTTSFTDVKADAYYAPYVAWAAKNSIVSGTSATTFAPDKAITRQEMAVMIAGYAKAIGFELPKLHTENVFKDNAKIGGFAKDAVKTMQMAGILAGKNGNKFDPTGTATRAEVSAVIRRFVELALDSGTAQGWMQNDSGKWMYFKDGVKLTGKQTIGGVSYNFNSNGETKTAPDWSFITYTVVKGDSFWSIAWDHKVNIFTLASVNGKSIFSTIHPGDELKIPEN